MSTEDGTNFLLNLPIKYFMSLCKSDALNIHSENTLIEFIQKYLKHRDGLPKLPEEEVRLDLSLLTDAEKEAREKLKNDKIVEETKVREEEKK